MILDILRQVNHGVLLGALLTLLLSWSWLASLLVRHLRYRRVGLQHEQELLRSSLPPDAALPHVLVQLPIYNEPNVARRLVDAMVALDWPRDKLHVQVLDDSTDETAAILSGQAASLRAQGFDVVHLHRLQRTDFKAGALKEGLKHAAHEYVAVVDADFIPHRDFLRLSLRPLIADARLAFVQTRWEFTNGGQNLVTRGQRAILDGYFGIFQTAQTWSGSIVDYNGTCAVWRRRAIDDAGGWSADTLGEDGDLSYRAHLRGWRARYLVTVTVPGELPDSFDVLCAQQSRWGMAWGQLARKYAVPVWRSDLRLGQKIAASGQMATTVSAVVAVVAVVTSVLDRLLGSGESVLADALGAVVALEAGGSMIAMATLAQVEFGHARPWPALRDSLAGTLLFAAVLVRGALSVVGGLGGATAAYSRTPKKGEPASLSQPIPAQVGKSGGRDT